jgi:Ser/Thr protein kinase RdoA (MazF antagonist)
MIMCPVVPDNPEAKRKQEAHRAALLDAIAAYARGPLVRRLGAPGPPTSVRPATRGVRSLVFLADFDGFPRVILRASEGWQRSARLAYNFRSFARLRLPVPRLLARDLSPLTRLRWGFYLLVEQFEQGQHPDDAPDREAATRAVARALARFHNVQARMWGWPGFPRLGSYRAHFLKRAAKSAAHLAPALATGQTGPLNAWFREHAAAAPLGSPFSLTHSRINCGNFVVRPDGEATLVDLVEARYGCFCPDLISAFDRLCERDERLMSAFLDEYFGGRPAACRETFEASRGFFEANRALARAGTYARRIARGPDAPDAPAFRARLQRQVARLAELTGIGLTLADP